FRFNYDPAPSSIYTLSLHDALPILQSRAARCGRWRVRVQHLQVQIQPLQSHAPALAVVALEHALEAAEDRRDARRPALARLEVRSEEHTSELQSRENLVCRLLLEKK